MQIISLKKSGTGVPCGAVWVLGFFDGVHLGHRQLLKAASSLAEQMGGENPLPVAVWSFAALPKAQILLTTREETAELLGECGAEWLVLADFADVSMLTGETFFRDHMVKPFSPAAIVCGFNFRFGVHGSSTAADLAEMGKAAGIPVQIVPPCTDETGETVSSTRIRNLIQEGNTERAAVLMGSPYSITAPVEHGKKLGRTIGFPTINQRMPKGKVIPANGIYISRVRFTEPDGRVVDLPGVCNIGYRPTVNSDTDDVTLETYILHYQGNLYGAAVTLSLYKKHRDEIKFSDVEALSRQIGQDASAAEAYFENREWRQS